MAVLVFVAGAIRMLVPLPTVLEFSQDHGVMLGPRGLVQIKELCLLCRASREMWFHLNESFNCAVSSRDRQDTEWVGSNCQQLDKLSFRGDQNNSADFYCIRCWKPRDTLKSV